MKWALHPEGSGDVFAAEYPDSWGEYQILADNDGTVHKAEPWTEWIRRSYRNGGSTKKRSGVSRGARAFLSSRKKKYRSYTNQRGKPVSSTKKMARKAKRATRPLAKFLLTVTRKKRIRVKKLKVRKSRSRGRKRKSNGGGFLGIL